MNGGMHACAYLHKRELFIHTYNIYTYETNGFINDNTIILYYVELLGLVVTHNRRDS